MMTFQSGFWDPTSLDRALAHDAWWLKYEPLIQKMLNAEIGPTVRTVQDRHPLFVCHTKLGDVRVWMRRLAWTPRYERQCTLRMTDHRLPTTDGYHTEGTELSLLSDGYGADFQICVVGLKGAPALLDWALFDLSVVRRWMSDNEPFPHLCRTNPADGNEYVRIPAHLLPSNACRLSADVYDLAASLRAAVTS